MHLITFLIQASMQKNNSYMILSHFPHMSASQAEAESADKLLLRRHRFICASHLLLSGINLLVLTLVTGDLSFFETRVLDVKVALDCLHEPVLSFLHHLLEFIRLEICHILSSELFRGDCSFDEFVSQVYIPESAQ